VSCTGECSARRAGTRIGVSEPSSEMLRAVCGALGLPVEHLLFRSGRRLGAANRNPATRSPNRQVPTLLAA